jgi:hypothetical protein
VNLWWPDGYTPPAPGIRRCPCGDLVITQVWVHGNTHTPPYWKHTGVVSVVFGEPHVCKEDAHDRDGVD